MLMVPAPALPSMTSFITEAVFWNSPSPLKFAPNRLSDVGIHADGLSADGIAEFVHRGGGLEVSAREPTASCPCRWPSAVLDVAELAIARDLYMVSSVRTVSVALRMLGHVAGIDQARHVADAIDLGRPELAGFNHRGGRHGVAARLGVLRADQGQQLALATLPRPALAMPYIGL